jgi:lysophospholipase L1-like esterase
LKKKIILTLLLLSFTFCSEEEKNYSFMGEEKNYTYLALGDSYTIGESVNATDRFPVQLTAQLNSSNYNVSNPEIIAKTGWTTDELLNEINKNEPINKYSLVTLLIGVNNQYRGGDPEIYREDFKVLLNKAISYTSSPKNVIVLSIPDWGVTPFAANTGRDPLKIKNEIDQFNSINESESLLLGVSYINITDISRDAENDLSLLAEDRLHPSGKMYSLWVERMIEPAKSILD